MLQEQAKGFSELLWAIIPDVKGAITIAITALITYLATRPKTKAEIYKTQADTDHIKVSTIQLLNDEIDDLIIKVSKLRKQVDKQDGATGTIRAKVESIIVMAQKVVDDLGGVSVLQVVKMQSVRVLENLYSLRDLLKDE